MATRPKTETIKRIVVFEAQTNSFEKTLKNIDRASADAAKSLRAMKKTTESIEASTKRTANSLDDFNSRVQKVSRVLKGLGLVYLAQQFFWLGRDVANAAVEMVKANDALTLMSTRLSRLGEAGGTSNLTVTAIQARELGVSLEEAAQQMQLLAPAFQRMGLSFGTTAQFAEDLTKSLRVFGTDARRSQIITVQLAQALSSGQLSGDELRSLSENAGGLALELERAVQKLLGTTDTLKDLGSQGRLTTAVLLQAFKEAFDGIRDQMEGLPDLWEYTTARLATAWQLFTATVADETNLGEKLKGVIDSVTEYIDTQTLNIKLKAEVIDIQTSPTEIIQKQYVESRQELEENVASGQRAIQAFLKQADFLGKSIANLRRENTLFSNAFADIQELELKLVEGRLIAAAKRAGVANKTLQGLIKELEVRADAAAFDSAFAAEEILFSSLESNTEFAKRQEEPLKELRKEITDVQRSYAELSRLISQAGKVNKDGFVTSTQTAAIANLNELQAELAKTLDELAKKEAELTRQIRAANGVVEERGSRLEEISLQAQANMRAAEDSRKAEERLAAQRKRVNAELSRSLKDIGRSITDNNRVYKDAQETLEQYAAEQEAGVEMTDDAKEAFAALVAVMVQMEQENDKLRLRQTGVNVALKANGEVLDENVDSTKAASAAVTFWTNQLKANQEAIDKAKKAAEEYNRKLQDAKQTYDNIRGSLDPLVALELERVRALTDLANAQTLLNKPFAEYLGLVNQVNDSYSQQRTDIQQNQADDQLQPFLDNLEEIQNAIKTLQDAIAENEKITLDAQEFKSNPQVAASLEFLNEQTARYREELIRLQGEEKKEKANIELLGGALDESGKRREYDAMATDAHTGSIERNIKAMEDQKKAAEDRDRELQRSLQLVREQKKQQEDLYKKLDELSNKQAAASKGGGPVSAEQVRLMEQQNREMETALANIDRLAAEETRLTEQIIANGGAIDNTNKLYDEQAKRIEGLTTAYAELEKRNKEREQSEERSRNNYLNIIAALDPLVAIELNRVQVLTDLGEAFTRLKLPMEEFLALQKRIDEQAKMASDGIKRYQGTLEGLGLRLKDDAFASFNSWIDSATQGSFKLSDALKDLLRQFTAMAAKAAIFKTVSSIFGADTVNGLFGLQAAAANGYAFPGGMDLSQGVYDSPTLFKFANGGRLGLLAEAGRSEAVLPLTRTSGGDLGVKAQAASINVNVVNQMGGRAEVQTRQVDPQTIELTIREIESRMMRGGNSTSRSFDSRYKR